MKFTFFLAVLVAALLLAAVVPAAIPPLIPSSEQRIASMEANRSAGNMTGDAARVALGKTGTFPGETTDLQFTPYMERDAGIVERGKGYLSQTEQMVYAWDMRDHLGVSVPVGHEDIGQAVLKDWMALPLALTYNIIADVIFSSYNSPDDANLSKLYNETFTTEARTFRGTIVVYGDNGTPKALSRGLFARELAHSFDVYGDDKYHISNSAGYKSAVGQDSIVDPTHDYVDDYARDAGRVLDRTSKKYSEDFAESVRMYVEDKANFFNLYPNRAAFVAGIFAAEVARIDEDRKRNAAEPPAQSWERSIITPTNMSDEEVVALLRGKKVA